MKQGRDPARSATPTPSTPHSRLRYTLCSDLVKQGRRPARSATPAPSTPHSRLRYTNPLLGFEPPPSYLTCCASGGEGGIDSLRSALRAHPADARSAALHKPSARVRLASLLPPFRRLRLEMAEREGLTRFARPFGRILRMLVPLRFTNPLLGFDSPLSCLPSGDFVLKWRRERDSNPRNLSVQWFSRPPHSAALPSLPRSLPYAGRRPFGQRFLTGANVGSAHHALR